VEEVQFGGKGKSKEARELNARIAREAELDKMERKVVLQMQLMGKGMARRVRRRDEDPDDEESIPVYKWKPQRKR
jgi:Utp11 protein